MNTFELAKGIRRLIVNNAAEAMVYGNWSDRFVSQQIKGLAEKIKAMDDYRPIELSELTEAQMEELGFGKWSNEDPMRLIPLWLYPFLPSTIYTKDVTGKVATLNKADLDTDNRFGCLAYGVYPSDAAQRTLEADLNHAEAVQQEQEEQQITAQ